MGRAVEVAVTPYGQSRSWPGAVTCDGSVAEVMQDRFLPVSRHLENRAVIGRAAQNGGAVKAAVGPKNQRAFGRTAIPDRGSYIGIGKGMDYCDSSVGFEPKKSAAVVDAVLTID